MKISLVRQEDGNGCGVACVAMLAGETYSYVRSLIERVPITQRDLEYLLFVNKLSFAKPEYDDLLPGKVYIMALPSLNKGGTMHYVVADVRDVLKIYDPNEGNTKDIYDNTRVCSWGRLIEVFVTKT